jgi:hypothetical protein
MERIAGGTCNRFVLSGGNEPRSPGRGHLLHCGPAARRSRKADDTCRRQTAAWRRASRCLATERHSRPLSGARFVAPSRPHVRRSRRRLRRRRLSAIPDVPEVDAAASARQRLANDGSTASLPRCFRNSGRSARGMFPDAQAAPNAGGARPTRAYPPSVSPRGEAADTGRSGRDEVQRNVMNDRRDVEDEARREGKCLRPRRRFGRRHSRCRRRIRGFPRVPAHRSRSRGTA